VLQIAGVNTREGAEALIGSEVWVSRDSLAPLDEDSYYVEDLTGFDVTDADGKHIGKVSGVLDNPAHDILRIIDAEETEILLPMVDEFVRNVNMFRGEIEVTLPEGLADLGGKGNTSLR
jgi:16S rRNA processing protein RimM